MRSSVPAASLMQGSIEPGRERRTAPAPPLGELSRVCRVSDLAGANAGQARPRSRDESMRKLLATTALILAAALAGGASPASAQGEDGKPWVEGELLVRFESGAER